MSPSKGDFVGFLASRDSFVLSGPKYWYQDRMGHVIHRSCFIFSIGTFKDEVFVGALGSWINLSPLAHELRLFENYFPKFQVAAITSWINVVLAVNCLVFMAWKTCNPVWMEKHFTASVFGTFTSRQLHALLTSSLSHSAWGHFALNMFCLARLGPLMAQRFGDGASLALYAAAAVMASLLSLFIRFCRGGHHLHVCSLGASGSLWAFRTALLASAHLETPASSAVMAGGRAMERLTVFGVPAAVAGKCGIFGGLFSQPAVDATLQLLMEALLSAGYLDVAAHAGGAVVGVAFALWV
jgi:membrane associated rhomboid family serine protease